MVVITSSVIKIIFKEMAPKKYKVNMSPAGIQLKTLEILQLEG